MADEYTNKAAIGASPEEDRDPLFVELQKLRAEAASWTRRRPLIEITRTKKIETQLTRIATALEQLLIQAYGYHTDIPTTDTRGPEPQVYYTDQDEHDIQDIVDDMKDRK